MKFEIVCHGCGRISEDNVPITNDEDYFFDVNCGECQFRLITFRGGMIKDDIEQRTS